MRNDLSKILAEFLGTAGLLIVVVGSGVMAQSLFQGNNGLALLANSLATGAGLYALIQTFGFISGAHFNPVVSWAEFLWGKLSRQELVLYIIAQVLGALSGVLLVHVMFGLDILQLSTRDRGGANYILSEFVATLGLLLVIALSGRKNVETTPLAVSLFITSAYWCTSSTSFANPAVTVARSLTDTFCGIEWKDAPGFIFAQILGAWVAVGLSRKLMPST